MRQCEEVARIAYEAFARELKKGKSSGQAMKDAFEAGAPRVFITYERARRLISVRHKTGQFPCRYKHMINVLETLYQWWLANPKGKNAANGCGSAEEWMSRRCGRWDLAYLVILSTNI